MITDISRSARDGRFPPAWLLVVVVERRPCGRHACVNRMRRLNVTDSVEDEDAADDCEHDLVLVPRDGADAPPSASEPVRHDDQRRH